MNRLLLVGNGFDIAHGMKTKYYDFIFDHVRNACVLSIKRGKHKSKLLTITRNENVHFTNIDNYSNMDELVLFENSRAELNAQILGYFSGTGVRQEYSKPFRATFENDFIELLFTKCQSSRWVDIENEFYNSLKKILTSNENAKKEKLEDLNGSMKILISELEEYISRQPTSNPVNGYSDIFKEQIETKDFAIPISDGDEGLNNSVVLNFNYTSTADQYLRDLPSCKINYIHGIAKTQSNPIIFGFGDELDPDYKKLEEEKEKGFLDYVKSFGYFKTSNYHNLIRFISSETYQVYILGHSCGLSDRTMLNMIFEHDNCKSIKIFYYGTKDKNNHFELTQEISRHFHNKTKMRERIVPLSQSFRMPQFDD